MQKIELISTLENSKGIIDFLQRKGVVEITEHEKPDSLSNLDTAVNVSQLEKMRTKAVQARDVLGFYAPQKSSLIDSFRPPDEIGLKEFLEKEDEADGIMNICYSILDCEKRITDAKAEIVRLNTANDALSVWEGLDVPIKSKPTKYTTLIVGTFPDLQTEASIKERLAEIAPELEAYDAEVVYSSDIQSCAAILCLKSEKDKMLDALRSFGFVKPSEAYDVTAKEAEQNNLLRIDKLNDKI